MRFGDNMREVAVTEGDKVEAQTKLGWQVNTWPVGTLVEYIDAVTEAEVDALSGGDAGSTAARGSALATEYRSHGGFTQCQAYFFADGLHTLCQTDRNGRLALAGGGGSQRTYQNELAALVGTLQSLQADLGLVQTVGDDVFFVQPGFGCHLCCE